MGINGASSAFGTLITLSRYVWFCQCSKTVQVLNVSDTVIAAVAFQFAWVHYCVTELFCVHPLPMGPVSHLCLM